MAVYLDAIEFYKYPHYYNILNELASWLELVNMFRQVKGRYSGLLRRSLIFIETAETEDPDVSW
jgi:hypothetical protein